MDCSFRSPKNSRLLAPSAPAHDHLQHIMDTRLQRLRDATGVTVCITKGMYEDKVVFDPDCTSIEIQGQNTGRDDWILQGALELRRDIHVFYRASSAQGFDYLGTVEHDHSQVIQEFSYGSGDLLEAVLFTTRGTNTMVNVGMSNNPNFRYKSAVFEHLQVAPERVFPASLYGCFNLIRSE